MAVFNIIGDISIGNTMFSATSAPFYALTPAPRRNTLLASVIAMFVMDFVTMALSITSVVLLSINLGNQFTDFNIWESMRGEIGLGVQNVLVPLVLLIAFYLFFLMLIMFCRTFRKSVLYNKHAGGFLAFLLAVGIFYLSTVSALLLAPFGTVTRLYVFFTVNVGFLGMGLYALLHLIFAAVMFHLTSRLMERKMNI